MENVKKVIVICGGSSSEREISLQSGQGVFKALCELGYETTLKDFNDLKDLYELKNFDFVFIALHGHEGEGGQLQRKLDDLKIVYSGSKSKACKDSWNKKLTKEILKDNKINTPIWLEVFFDMTLAKNGLQTSSYDRFRPFNYLFLKPEEDGSSTDIFKISNDEELIDAYKRCSNPNRNFLFEEYIDGKELTVTIIDGESFPPLEIITENEFYDYDAKYISNNTKLSKAELSNDELNEINAISLSAYNLLDCSGWARIDFIQNKKGIFYIIEINTVPGMTSHSCVPKSASLVGVSYNKVVQKIIDASF